MSSNGGAVITVDKLVKTYGSLRAVDGISFSVRRGEVFGLLGPNGAGKTTTLEIIESLKKRTSGTVDVLGLDPSKQRDAVKERIGVQLQAAAYYDELTLTELLDLFGSFYKKKRAPADLLKEVNLTDKAKARVGQLSGGQRQRFSIAASLVNDPEVVFLDEPTTGLDPQARRNLWDFILRLKASDRTVVLTTHYMEEAELLADRLAIIDHGKIVSMGTPRELIASLDRACTVTFVLRGPSKLEELKKLPTVRAGEQLNAETYKLVVGQPATLLPQLFTWARQAQLNVEDLQVNPATLEDVFLAKTGHELRD
ncbi:MAG: ABC transporter ATP-binding protein [Candidatus Andersenbacteria bacterium]